MKGLASNDRQHLPAIAFGRNGPVGENSCVAHRFPSPGETRHNKPDKGMKEIDDSHQLLETDRKIVPAFYMRQFMGQDRFKGSTPGRVDQMLRQDNHRPKKPHGKAWYI